MLVRKLIFIFILKSLEFVACDNASREYHDIENVLRILNNNFSSNFMEFMQEAKSRNIDNRLCVNQTKQIVSDLKNFEYYALEFIDSWGKIPAGILKGNLKQIGNFDECLNISKTIDDKRNIGAIRGKHCMITFPLKKIIDLIKDKIKPETSSKLMKYQVPDIPGLEFGMGICLPETCGLNFVEKRLKEFIESTVDIKINFSLINGKCIQHNDLYTDFDVMDWIAIVFFSGMIIIIFSSSVYDYVTRKAGAQQNQLFISFSIVTNGEKLFRIQKVKTPNVIECLNGMRCLSMVWIVYDHSLLLSAQLMNTNTLQMFGFLNEFSSMIFIQGTVAVDTFFFLSGFLLMWAVCKEMDKGNGKVNILMMYLHRYIRLTPVVAVIILFVVSFYRHMSSGPLWHVTQDTFITPCQDNWWVTLLYVQNYVNIDRPCLPHAWYLSVDTQLFFLSPLIVIPLYKWGKRFIPVVIVLAALSIGYVFAVSLKYGYGLGIMGGGRSPVDTSFMKLVYKGTQSRYSPWLVGILLAFGMYKSKNRRIRLHKVLVGLGWLLSLGTMLAVIFGPYHRMQKNAEPYTDLEAAFYGSLHRFSWSVALAWLVFACQIGYGGLINSMLSWTIWQPFGRLTYSIYLVHYTLQYLINSNMKVETHFSQFEILQRFWSDFGLSLTISVITVLAFELPILSLEKVLFKSRSTKSKIPKEIPESSKF